MKIVAFLERDFRTKRNDRQARHIGVNDDDDDVTRRAEAGVLPQYQKGTRPPTGLGSIVTSSNS